MTEIEARSTTLALRREIIEHKETEQRLRWLLTEKEILLREVHHRVGNNLQVVDTLLMLEIRQPTISTESLRNLQQRVHALGLIHRKVMRSENLEKIGLEEFVSALCQALTEVHVGQHVDTSLNVAVETGNLFIDIDLAIPLGLLINELITCAYKRDFPSRQRGIVAVSLNVQKSGEAQLVVADNGIGTPDAPLQCAAMGERIVAQLIRQLGADMTTQRCDGTRVIVTIPISR
jgi:two-component sensor histidine kinase